MSLGYIKVGLQTVGGAIIAIEAAEVAAVVVAAGVAVAVGYGGYRAVKYLAEKNQKGQFLSRGNRRKRGRTRRLALAE
ncbi:MAG TPA: hypothetical protein VKS81_05690 [Bacteroidota bacterium]|nr:hypothetical protein [Bacteroidota bacterium]